MENSYDSVRSIIDGRDCKILCPHGKIIFSKCITYKLIGKSNLIHRVRFRKQNMCNGDSLELSSYFIFLRN